MEIQGLMSEKLPYKERVLGGIEIARELLTKIHICVELIGCK